MPPEDPERHKTGQLAGFASNIELAPEPVKSPLVANQSPQPLH
jgi:hypothetical protein